MRLWDVAVIGTGMGGATVGHALALAGHSVLFIEKGHATFPDAADGIQLQNQDPAERLNNAIWPTAISGEVDAAPVRLLAPLGCGAGGSTLLFAAALERFDPSDFMASPLESQKPGWPLSYQELSPYYQRAEALFGVSGSDDPLGSDKEGSLMRPQSLSDCDAHFFDAFEAKGLHPYRLHVGREFLPGCTECLGHICRRNCKNDAKKVCLTPALASGNAQMLDDCEVEQLVATVSSVREINCRRRGQKLTIRARMVILAAGALFSPAVLLRSRSQYWPHGLANTSGLVGRNLMFHVSDHIAVWPPRKLRSQDARKALAFRDFYRVDGHKFGLVQSTGFNVGYGNVLYSLRNEFDRSRWRGVKPLRPLLRVVALLASAALGRASVFATVTEDLPYPENRVILDDKEPSGIRFQYRIHSELRHRNELLRQLIKESLAPHRVMLLDRALGLNYGHPCGTCRFGSDPRSSVLDANNKAHGIDNLYVVDASFMPSSGGANPALTIAANALRVAEHVSAALGASASGSPIKTLHS